MDYEEKYNKLVEAVRVLQETNHSDEGIQNWVNDNVPELAESEDEKIRKSLLLYLHGLGEFEYPDKKTYNDWLSWLEKQKKEENKNCDEECKNAYNAGYLDGLSSYQKGYLDGLSSYQNELDYAYKCADEVQYRRGYEDGVASVLKTTTARKFKVGDKIRSKNGCYHDEVVEVREDGAYKLRDLGELYLPEKEWELDNWRPSGKQMAAFEVMLNSEKKHNWFCDDVRLLMQSLYDDLKLVNYPQTKDLWACH